MKVIIVDANNRWLYYGEVPSFDVAFDIASESDLYDTNYTMYAFKIAELDETGPIKAERPGLDEE